MYGSACGFALLQRSIAGIMYSIIIISKARRVESYMDGGNALPNGRTSKWAERS